GCELYGWQPLPLYRLSSNPQSDPPGRQSDATAGTRAPMSGEKIRMKPEEFRVVNHSVPREDGVAKVTGRAVFTSDIRLEGMAYAKLLRSPFAPARILSIDMDEVLRQPGVIAVLSGNDLHGIDPYYGHAVKDHPLLALGKVRFLGEPVAAVVAEDERSAYEALESVRVEYE